MVTIKTECTSCTNWTISFEVWGFRTKTHLLQRHFFFLTYFNSKLFVHSICTIQSHIHKFQPFLTSFAIFHAFNDFFELNDPEIENCTNQLWKGWNLAWCHHFTHIQCVQKLRGLRQTLDALRVQTGPSPSRYEGFRTKTHLLWKGWNLPWYHHFTHIASAQKLQGLRQKLDAFRVQIGPSPSKYEGFRRKHISTAYFLCIQSAPFKATSLNLNPF